LQTAPNSVGREVSCGYAVPDNLTGLVDADNKQTAYVCDAQY
jgi:hypothetical protein